jgi:hypothetical protein
MDLRELPDVLPARHPWERARARFFNLVLAQAGLPSSPCAVLDLGAGDAYVAGRLIARLPAGSSMTCVDDRYSDAIVARLSVDAPRGLTFQRERPARRFDLVLLLDVLEHVRDDGRWLSELVATSLAPNGVILISVPAFRWLFTERDHLLGHYRRYTASSLRAVLDESGLTVQRSGGLFHSLVIPRATQRLVERVRGPRKLPDSGPPAAIETELGRWRAGAVGTALACAWLAGDVACALAASRLGVTLPGTSLWAICTRKVNA